MAMERAHAQLLGQLAFGARERSLAVWVSESYRDALEKACRTCPRFIDDADLNRRCPGLPGQLAHVGMLWLDRHRVVCRLEAISAGRPSSRFPGPDRVRCLAIIDREEQAGPLRRAGWATLLSRDLDQYLRRVAVPAPTSRPACEAHVSVVNVEPRGADAYCLTLASDLIAEAARPGQFVLLECVSRGERLAFARAKNTPRDEVAGMTADPKLPLLRRPFGIHRLTGPDYSPDRLSEAPPFPPQLLSIIEPGRGRTFDILFKVVGRGTQRLARMRPGESLAARAPLGRPVDIRPDLGSAVLVAGGMGAGPLFAIAQELRRQGRHVHAVLGAVDRASTPVAPSEFEEIGCRAALVTEKEDGLLVTQYVERRLSEMIAGVTEMFACGPAGMLREVARIAPPGMRAQVLMEQRMACGMGVCRGCVVAVRSQEGRTEYRTVCRDGPAFRAEEVAWEELAATTR
jgi:dihydroorotate dehydrogenase electron transfer subunit